MTPLELVRFHFPWDVPEHLQPSPVYELLRIHGDWVATGGHGMDVEALIQLLAFHAKLREDGLVVEFDPNITAADGVDGKAGFAFRPRQSTDDDLLVRDNGYTVLTEDGREIWRFPDMDPVC